MADETYVFQQTVLKPHFDVKVALTTRGWSWEIEIKDCANVEEFNALFDAAKDAVSKKMAGYETE